MYADFLCEVDASYSNGGVYTIEGDAMSQVNVPSNNNGDYMLSRTTHGLVLILAVTPIFKGCWRDNGLPGDLTRHLADRGVQITPLRFHAPLSSRGGYVVTRHIPETASNLVATFKLERIQHEDRQ